MQYKFIVLNKVTAEGATYRVGKLVSVDEPIKAPVVELDGPSSPFRNYGLVDDDVVIYREQLVGREGQLYKANIIKTVGHVV